MQGDSRSLAYLSRHVKYERKILCRSMQGWYILEQNSRIRSTRFYFSTAIDKRMHVGMPHHGTGKVLQMLTKRLRAALSIVSSIIRADVA